MFRMGSLRLPSSSSQGPWSFVHSPVPNPTDAPWHVQHAAYLILRGLKTLDLRVQRQNNTAMRLARALEGHPKVHTELTGPLY